MAERSVAIVTGASSGIGMETAVAFARRGYAVALAARRKDRLDEVARKCAQAAGKESLDDYLVAPIDVADQSQMEDLVEISMKKFGRVDVMVNNAGFGVFERVHETSEADMRRIFDVNFFGVFYGCKAVAPVMIRQGSGHIFNVSSVIGKRGTPFHGAYCATKFAIIGLTESMRVEMKPYHVYVTAVCPALTETEFFQRSARGEQAGQSFEHFKHLMPARAVGEKIARTAGEAKPEIVFSAGGKFLTLASALFPRLVDWGMKFYLNDLTKTLNEVEKSR